MKKSFLIILISLLILSCENSETAKRKAREKAVQDSISFVQEKNKQIEKARIDSLQKIEQARLDSIQKEEEIKVVGDIRFGMNKKEFEKYKKEFENKCKVLSWQSGNTKFYDNKIGDYEFNYLYGGYYKEKLYYVQIKGTPIKYEYYDKDMKSQVVALFSILNNKYGTPNQDYGLPSWTTINKGDSYCCAYWSKGDKVIQMRVESEGIYYNLNLEMFQFSISSQMKKEREEEEKEAIKKGTEIL